MLRSILQSGRTSILQPLIKPDTFIAQQTRNTIVVKRKWEPLLAKKGSVPRRLKGKNFVYNFVENAETLAKPNINVILTKYVNELGYVGDLVSVRPHYAYSKLLLPGLAVYDNPENRAKYGTEEKLLQERRSPYIERTIGVFGRRTVTVAMNKLKPWTIEPWHIRASMRKAGLYVLNDSQIELPKERISGPDLGKQSKLFFVTVTINNEYKARVKCQIHHWCSDPKLQVPYDPEYQKQQVYLFPEDEEEAKAMAKAKKEFEANPTAVLVN